MIYTQGHYFDVLLFGLTSDEFAARGYDSIRGGGS